MQTLAERQKNYEKSQENRLLNRVPIICRVDGKNFHRVCSQLKKPYEPLLLEALAQTAIILVGYIDGAVFAYQQSDEITFVIKNDQSLDTQPWFSNRIQKIVSTIASLTTYHFNKIIGKYNLDLVGDLCFDARVFVVPSVGEACNNIIWRQQDASRNAINAACQTLLTQKLGKNAIQLLHKKNNNEKITLMLEKCGIDFEQEYPNAYRRGIGVYKIPTIITTKQDTITRKKWIIDWNLPDLVEQREFLYNIILNGSDILRINNISQ